MVLVGYYPEGGCQSIDYFHRGRTVSGIERVHVAATLDASTSLDALAQYWTNVGPAS